MNFAQSGKSNGNFVVCKETFEKDMKIQGKVGEFKNQWLQLSVQKEKIYFLERLARHISLFNGGYC